MADLMKRLGLELPLIQAPMGGGFTPVGLVAAVSEAGALGSLGAPYLQPDVIRAEAAEIRKRTSRPFGINLFTFDQPAASDTEIDRTIEMLEPYCEELSIATPEPGGPYHPDIDAQIEAVLEVRPAVFSFTLGMPSPAVVAEMKRRDILVVGTATTLAEGLALEALGVDAVCAQGGEAGGHRGTFLGPWQEGLVGVAALVPVLKSRLSVPVIAAGGLMNGAQCRAMLALGAEAVQLGTAFMICPEAGTSEVHKAAVLSDAAARTAVTSAFSGAPARGIVNRYMIEMEKKADRLAPFPVTNSLTRGLRGAAAKANRPEFISLWAGQGAPLARVMPAGELVATLKAEMGLG
jgi:nitronate monooxygenase